MFGNAVAGLARVRSHAHLRRALRDLPDHLPDDIGLKRADSVAEAGRPFWDSQRQGPNAPDIVRRLPRITTAF